MKPLEQWTQADLQALIGTPESLMVDFKQSEAILIHGPNKEKVRASLVKDITALANAAGGRVYYGLREDKTTNVATELDDGVTLDDAKADVIADIITGNTEPQIVSLSVHEVRLDNGRYAFVINVPQATTLAPHQSRYDHVYYRRHDRKILKMYDHEIKDVMRRADTPHIVTKMNRRTSERSAHQVYWVEYENISESLVKYYTVDIVVDVGLSFLHQPHPMKDCGVVNITTTDGDAWEGRRYLLHMTPANSIPLFKGQRSTLFMIQSDPPVEARFTRYAFVEILAPGFRANWLATLSFEHTWEVFTYEEVPRQDVPF